MVKKMIEGEKIATRDKILLAAKEVFIEKGKDGARMQEIADRAGVNKAMLFYYYTNKDLLYKEILKTNISQIFIHVQKIFISEIDPKKKIEQVVSAYFNFISENRDLPKLILREIASGGDNIKEVIMDIKKNVPFDIPHNIIAMINESIKKNQFRKIDPQQTVISIVGMCLIYFIGKPILDAIFELEDDKEKQFLTKRKKSIIDLLENGILFKE